MARQRRTLALILICLPILVTVITAFRIRDLPKNFDDNAKSELKKQKCENCDVNEAKVVRNVKIESGKRYEELKKAVREKQQQINQKSESKISYKFTDDSGDDDDDDGLEFFKKDSDFKRDKVVKESKVDKGGSGLKLDSVNKKAVSLDSDDDDDDDDDDHDDVLSKKTKNVDIKTKLDWEKKLKPKDSKIEKEKSGIKSVHDNNKDDEDRNDVRQKSIKVDSILRTESEIKQKPRVNNEKMPAKKIELVDHSDDSEGDDSEDDDKDKKHKKADLKANDDSLVKVKSILKGKEVVTKSKAASDDDDDDNKDDHAMKKIKQVDSKKSPGVTANEKTKSPKEKTTAIKITIHDDDDDDDDEDDDNDDDVPSFFTKVKELFKPVIEIPFKEDLKDNQKDSLKENDVKGDKINKKPVKKEPSVKPETKKSEPVKKESKPATKSNDENKPSNQAKTATVIKKDDSIQKDPIKKQKEPDKDAIKSKPPQEVKSKSHEEIKKSEKKSSPEPKGSNKDAKPSVKSHEKRDKSVEMLVDSKEVFSGSETHLKDVNDALQRRNLLQSEFEDFYAFLPTFAPNFSRIHNPECRRHGQILLRQLRGTKLWALNMLDATAKIPSGLLQGNGIQLGDFDQCLSSRARVQLDTGSVVKVQGQYCLARLDLKAEHPELELPVHLAQAKNLVRSRIDDPGHFVPRFSTLSWGVCVPAACNPEDVEVVIKDALKHYQHKSGVVIRVKVDSDDCHTQDGDAWEDWMELPTVLTLSFYGVIVLLVLVATAQDFVARRKLEESQSTEGDDKAECDQKDSKGEEENDVVEKSADGFLSSFSLYRTISKLVAPGTSDEITCIHGIRAVATVALLVVHKFLPVAVMPYTNRVKITEVVSSPLWSWCRAGWMFTDCFLLLSGALTSYRISADSDTGAPKRLMSRYLRLTPALLAVVLFYAYIWDNISSGPMWGTLVTKNAEVCQDGWWWNLLYVQNYFGFEEMCAPQTHQLALDFQLTILGCIIVWAMQAKPGLSRVLLPSIHAVAAYSRYATVREHRLTMLAYHGVSVSQLYRTARLSYTSTLHRSTPYLVGISLGLLLQRPSEHGKITLALGWLLSVSLWSLVWWAGLDSGYTTYRYSADFAAQYAALAPIASALAIAWVIYAVHSGSSDGFLSRLLCSRPLVFISRLSYALYLCQFVVFLTRAATVKTSTEFTLMSLIDLHEISLILISSTILTLTFVQPMQSLHKFLTFSSKSEAQKKSESEVEKKEGSAEPDKGEKDPQIEEPEIEEFEVPQTKRPHFMAHREVLEEIPEVELEYEAQRDKIEGLEEILEEEEDEEADEDLQNHLDEDDLEIIEEEQGGEDDYWAEREEYAPRRSFSRNEDQDLDEWEWTANGSGRNGAQYYRHTR